MSTSTSQTLETPASPRRPLILRCTGAVRGWWRRLWMDDRDEYLSRATDCADLERRMRAWDEAERRYRMPLF